MNKQKPIIKIYCKYEIEVERSKDSKSITAETFSIKNTDIKYIKEKMRTLIEEQIDKICKYTLN